MNTQHATFAGGCFWCMVPPFKELGGVISVEAGYTFFPKQIQIKTGKNPDNTRFSPFHTLPQEVV